MTSRSRGGEGGCPKHDVVREVAWIYSYDWSKMRDKGGRGSEKPQNLRDVIYGWSLTSLYHCSLVSPLNEPRDLEPLRYPRFVLKDFFSVVMLTHYLQRIFAGEAEYSLYDKC